MLDKRQEMHAHKPETPSGALELSESADPSPNLWRSSISDFQIESGSAAGSENVRLRTHGRDFTAKQ
jgi:hypothetical protein